MTAGKAKDAAAASAKAQAEAFAEQRVTVSERQARETNGSDVEVSQAGWTPPSVAWPSPSTAGQPPAVSPQPTPSPKCDRPARHPPVAVGPGGGSLRACHRCGRPRGWSFPGASALSWSLLPVRAAARPFGMA